MCVCVYSCVSAQPVPFRGYHFYPLSISQTRISSSRLSFHRVPPYLFLLSIQLMRPLWLTDIRGFIHIISSRTWKRRLLFSRSNVETRSLRLHHHGLHHSLFRKVATQLWTRSSSSSLAKFPEGECRNVDRPSILDDDSLSCDRAGRYYHQLSRASRSIAHPSYA